MTQTVACNTHHSLPQQWCRRLLLSLDRLRDHHLRMTQQLVANMLGVPSEHISQVAAELQRTAIIRVEDRCITVMDLEGLEQRSCECYAVAKREYDRLLPRAARSCRVRV